MTRSAAHKLADQGIQQLRNKASSTTTTTSSQSMTSSTRRQPAQSWRGGTSNGVMIAGPTLPEWQIIRDQYRHHQHSSTRNLNLDLKQCAELLQPVYQAIFGSPDPYGRQLNGMGGGLSSLSKAVIVDTSTAPDEFDLDYLFIQVGIRDGKLDLAGNCGNMTAAVAPFALECFRESLARTTTAAAAAGGSGNRNRNGGYDMGDGKGQVVETSTGPRLMRPAIFRLRNLNTNRGILAEIMTSRAINSNNDEGDGQGEGAEHEDWVFEERGDYAMDGSPGYASPITLSFTSPGGAKTGKALPTGNATDTVEYAPDRHVAASLLDISNPGVFIDGRDVGWDPARPPDALNADTALMQKLEAIRRAGAAMMGMDPDTPSVPKVVLLFPPAADHVDITCQALSMEQAHKAVPMTLGLNLGVACKIPGTIAHRLARHRDPRTTIVGHPSGRVEVGADIDLESGEIVSARVLRTARCLMEGSVNVTRNEKLCIRHY